MQEPLPDPAFFVAAALALIGLGGLLATLFFKCHVIPSHYIRRRRNTGPNLQSPPF